MADFFGHNQFGSGHFNAMSPQGQPHPGFNPGFERLVAPGVQFSAGIGSRLRGTGFTTQASGGVVFANGGKRKK